MSELQDDFNILRDHIKKLNKIIEIQKKAIEFVSNSDLDFDIQDVYELIEET